MSDRARHIQLHNFPTQVPKISFTKPLHFFMAGKHFADYVSAAHATGRVGEACAELALALVAAGSSLDLIHPIGFSLGAHVVGKMGSQLGGRLARVTALDPAGELNDAKDYF